MPPEARRTRGAPRGGKASARRGLRATGRKAADSLQRPRVHETRSASFGSAVSSPPVKRFRTTTGAFRSPASTCAERARLVPITMSGTSAAAAVESPPARRVCVNCGGAAQKRCSECKKRGIAVCYCGRECQLRDWKAHKKHCGTAQAQNVDIQRILFVNPEEGTVESMLQHVSDRAGWQVLDFSDRLLRNDFSLDYFKRVFSSHAGQALDNDFSLDDSSSIFTPLSTSVRSCCLTYENFMILLTWCTYCITQRCSKGLALLMTADASSERDSSTTSRPSSTIATASETLS